MIYQDRIETSCLSFVLLFLKSTLLLNCSKHNWKALTRLGHQGRRRVYWERPFFKLCATHFSKEGQNFIQGRLSPALLVSLRA